MPSSGKRKNRRGGKRRNYAALNAGRPEPNVSVKTPNVTPPPAADAPTPPGTTVGRPPVDIQTPHLASTSRSLEPKVIITSTPANNDRSSLVINVPNTDESDSDIDQLEKTLSAKKQQLEVANKRKERKAQLQKEIQEIDKKLAKPTPATSRSVSFKTKNVDKPSTSKNSSDSMYDQILQSQMAVVEGARGASGADWSHPPARTSARSSMTIPTPWVDDSDEEEEADVRRSSLRAMPGNPGKSSLSSGMDAKASNVIKYPQLWPHVALQDEFLGSDLGFMDLDFYLYIAGELELVIPSTNDPEARGRLWLARQGAYLLHHGYSWDFVRSAYTTILRKIELGILQWDSSFEREYQWFLSRSNTKPKFSKSSQPTKKPRSKTSTWFCKNFNYNNCPHSENHTETINGRPTLHEHICANCWLKEGTKLVHPSSSSACPHFN